MTGTRSEPTPRPGISGIALYVPRTRVDLERWCDWTGSPWPKVSQVVGHGFRVCGPRQNAYTMAAAAVLRLIDQEGIDPRDVGFLALGTESSTDNAAGAVIVKGMVNEALRARGSAPIGRACEVPEFKHACLGGVYATKAAARWLALDGQGRRAIVVSSDIAEYAAGSSGEQTQGAGAVAFVMDREPQLLALDLNRAGASSDYRGVDFRKPFARHFMGETASVDGVPPRDYPVFNGKYSTVCYTEAVAEAFAGLFDRVTHDERDAYAWLDDLAAVFCHRPYHHMPVAGLAWALAACLLRQPPAAGPSPFSQIDLGELARRAEVELDQARAELDAGVELFDHVREHGVDDDPYPGVSKLARALRREPAFRSFVELKLGLGEQWVREFGNLYTASLPAWLAAGLRDAADRDLALAGREILLLGYGSGDAAEAIPGRLVEGWEAAARRIDVPGALADPIDLDEARYRELHAGRDEAPAGADLPDDTNGPFVVDRLGVHNDSKYADVGVEFYRYELSGP